MLVHGSGVVHALHCVTAYVHITEIASPTQIYVRTCHWWFNYPVPLLDVELEFACLSG